MLLLARLLREARLGQRYLVFIDEAHVYQEARLGYGWAPEEERFWVPSHSIAHREKVTFYGVYLYNEGKVRIWAHRKAEQQRTRDVLSALRRELPDAPHLTVIWDNARYHTAEDVHTFARERRGIEIVQLPKYSPDLMPVEELWNWFRQDVTRNRSFLNRFDLIRAAREFETRINSIPYLVADRLVVREELDPEREKLLVSS